MVGTGDQEERVVLRVGGPRLQEERTRRLAALRSPCDLERSDEIDAVEQKIDPAARSVGVEGSRQNLSLLRQIDVARSTVGDRQLAARRVVFPAHPSGSQQ